MPLITAPKVDGRLFSDPARAVDVPASAGAHASRARAHLGHGAGQALRIAKEARRLLDGAPLQRSMGDLRPVLALVSVCGSNAGDSHQLLHGWHFPRTRMPRMLMQKVSARLYLLEIEGRGEVHVLDRLRIGGCVSRRSGIGRC